jgi:limonene-1,2-epoxide hydrolase
MDSPEATVTAFVAAFIRAWPSADGSGLGRFFSEHATYVNGPLAPVRGRTAVVASLTQMMAMGGEVDVDVLQLIAEGPLVMTERVDYWWTDTAAASLRVAGVFEVRDGAITAWRDYFDGDEFAAHLSAGNGTESKT